MGTDAPPIDDREPDVPGRGPALPLSAEPRVDGRLPAWGVNCCSGCGAY